MTEQNYVARNTLMNTICYEKVLEAVKDGKQAMVFVHSRKVRPRPTRLVSRQAFRIGSRLPGFLFHRWKRNNTKATPASSNRFPLCSLLSRHSRLSFLGNCRCKKNARCITTVSASGSARFRTFPFQPRQLSPWCVQDTVKSARILVELAAKRGDVSLFEPEATEQAGLWKKEVAKSRARELAELYDSGFGTHHAGMLRSDRNLTEKLFSMGLLKVGPS